MFQRDVTIDRKLERQCKLADLKLGIISAHVPSNEIAAYEPIFPNLLRVIAMARPGAVIHVGAGA
jgi:hypothetical protein